MTIFQPKLLYYNNKYAPLKTIIVPVILLFCWFNLSAQEDRSIKLKIETGILWTSNSGNPDWPKYSGIFLNVEPKLKTSRNTFLGLRIGISVNEQKKDFFDLHHIYSINNPQKGIIQFTNPTNGAFSLVPTFDYYFIENKFRPYLGVGLGYYFLTNYKKVSRIGTANPSEDLLEVIVNNQVGFLVRGGLNLSKWILGLEFNYIPKAEIELSDGQILGAVNNTYVGLSIGYAIGIGKSYK